MGSIKEVGTHLLVSPFDLRAGKTPKCSCPTPARDCGQKLDRRLLGPCPPQLFACWPKDSSSREKLCRGPSRLETIASVSNSLFLASAPRLQGHPMGRKGPGAPGSGEGFLNGDGSGSGLPGIPAPCMTLGCPSTSGSRLWNGYLLAVGAVPGQAWHPRLLSPGAPGCVEKEQHWGSLVPGSTVHSEGSGQVPAFCTQMQALCKLQWSWRKGWSQRKWGYLHWRGRYTEQWE